MIEKYTALYSDLDIEYSQVMSGPYEDICYRGDDAVVIAGLKDGRISGFWRPMVAFGDDKALKMQIESLWDVSQDIYYQDYLIDGKLSVISQFLLRHGYIARPYYTQIIDLTKTEEELHADLRKSYKSLVNKVSQADIYSFNDISCVQMVHSVSRNQESWDVQKQMIESEAAFCIDYAQNHGNTCPPYAGGIFYHNKYSCYYATGCSRSNVNTHPLLWKAILYAKKLGIKSFEMGEQLFSGEEKLVNISKFKRGFGGKTVMRLNLTKE